jgi:3-oxoacyl-[acyl-carrier-protein] synthase-3
MNLQAYITRSGSFLPNAAIENDEMEDYLGTIGGRKSKSRRIVLRSNRITSRYYAMNRDGVATHSNAEMVAQAIRSELDEPEIRSIDLLCCGTSSPDQLMPSHALMVHGLLPETANIEVISPSGVCCSGMHALKYAYMAVKLGEAKKAVVPGSERPSRLMRSENFNEEPGTVERLNSHPCLAFEKDFLRWMLSDGAGFFLLEDGPTKQGTSLRIDWIDACSFANENEVCMYQGGEKIDGKLTSYKDYSSKETQQKDLFSIKQDVRLLEQKIRQLGCGKLSQASRERGLESKEVTYFLPHISSMYFADKLDVGLRKVNFAIDQEKWFTNLPRVGNVGSASIYLMLDELIKTKSLVKDDKILLWVPESARFSYVFVLLTVV